MKKSALLLNLLWAGIAAGTFYAGMKMKDPASSGNNEPVKRTTTANAAGTDSSAAQKGRTVNARFVSQDDSVLDFLQRYGIGSGPVAPEMMKKAISEAVRETNPVKSQMLFARLMEELTPENAASVLSALRENVSGFENMRYMPMLAFAWGGVDAQAAMKEMAEGGDRWGRGFNQASVLQGWAAKDAQGAISWLDKFEGDPREKEWMSTSLVSGLAKSDFDAAQKFASALKEDGERSRAAESLAREMIRMSGVEKAEQWFGTLTDPRMKASAFDTVAQQLLRSDPEKAVAFAKQHAAEDFAKNAVGNVAETLARKDVKQGLEFAGSLQGASQARAYGEVVNQWMEKDRGAEAEAASTFVKEMQPGPARDAGAKAIVDNISREDPVSGIAWANSIQDTELKSEALIEAGRRYFRTNQQEAQAWLATSGLNAEQQQQVTNPRPEWGGRGGPGGPPPGGGGRRGGGGGGR
ncbi:MAG: hypothetical protein KA004_07275 [Verrucomicrobiales bacterium]|nr:hypothetical protein [Verrucomicrobiales bacterium]